MSNMLFEEMLIIIILFVAVIIIASVIVNLKEKEMQSLDESYKMLLKQWKEYVETTNKTKQNLWQEIEDLKTENEKLKEQNVSRETSYNPSFGIPEVVDWIDQHQPTGEEIKHG